MSHVRLSCRMGSVERVRAQLVLANQGGIDAETAKRLANLVKDGIDSCGGWELQLQVAGLLRSRSSCMHALASKIITFGF